MTGIQQDHIHSTLANFNDVYGSSKVYKTIKEVAVQLYNSTLPYRFVFLTGQCGSGKTHALVGLYRLRAHADEGVLGAEAGLYTPFAMMIEDVIQAIGETHSTRLAVAKYYPVKYLFIDDISRGERVINPERIEGQVFRDVLLDRWENCKHLICTSNYTPADLQRMIKNVFGDYVLSRVLGSCKFVEFPKGLDMRREGSSKV